MKRNLLYFTYYTTTWGVSQGHDVIAIADEWLLILKAEIIIT